MKRRLHGKGTTWSGEKGHTERGHIRRGNYMVKGKGIYKEGTTWSGERRYTRKWRGDHMEKGGDIHGEGTQKNTRISRISNQSTNYFILFSDKLLRNIIYSDQLYPI